MSVTHHHHDQGHVHVIVIVPKDLRMTSNQPWHANKADTQKLPKLEHTESNTLQFTQMK